MDPALGGALPVVLEWQGGGAGTFSILQVGPAPRVLGAPGRLESLRVLAGSRQQAGLGRVRRVEPSCPVRLASCLCRVCAANRRAVLAWLQWLRLSAALTPGDPWFGLAAFCLRSVLDEFAERMGPQLMPASPELHDPPAAQRLPASPTVAGQGEAPAGIPGALSPAPREGGSEAGSHAAAPPAAVGSAGLAGSPTGRTASSDPFGALAACDRLLDRRFVQLCCPALAHAQQLFRSRAGSGSGALGNGTPGSRGSAAGGLAARRAKKIRPTAPSGLAAARVALQVLLAWHARTCSRAPARSNPLGSGRGAQQLGLVPARPGRMGDHPGAH